MADIHKRDPSQYNGDALVCTAVMFLAVTWITVVLRSYTRVVLTRSFQLDDWLMLVAQAIFTASCSFILAGVSVGLGHHDDAITGEDRKSEALMWQALATAAYVLDMMFIKLSIAFFLLRISAHKVYRYILWASLVVITVWSSVIFFWDLFQCNPVARQWDRRIKGGKCVPAEQVVSAAYAISVMTIVSDWLYALLPIPMLWNVQMTTQAKATLIVILGLGIFASVATLVRLRFLADLEDTNDILYAGTDAMVWTLVEPGVAIVASSLATIRPLLRAMRVRGFESTAPAASTAAHPGAAGSRSTWRKQSRAGDPSSGRGTDEMYLTEIRISDVGDKPSRYSNTAPLFERHPDGDGVAPFQSTIVGSRHGDDVGDIA